MSARRYDPTERIGLNAVERIVTADFKWIWREQPVADFGIDAQIEVVDRYRKPTGKLIAVQVKTGVSYFQGARETHPFYIDQEHLKYWDQHSLPVILILHNPDDEQTIWQRADLHSARPTKTRWCIDVPKTKAFDAECMSELQGQVWMDDSISLRRRFALDRQFMNILKGRDAFVTIRLWLNKSLRFREIQVRFDDPYKESPDYEIPIMVTWNYEVSDLMRHFLPWLEYDYFEEPEENSGEVEDHVMAVWLSKPGEAFLELEAFFENAPAAL